MINACVSIYIQFSSRATSPSILTGKNGECCDACHWSFVLNDWFLFIISHNLLHSFECVHFPLPMDLKLLKKRRELYDIDDEHCNSTDACFYHYRYEFDNIAYGDNDYGGNKQNSKPMYDPMCPHYNNTFLFSCKDNQFVKYIILQSIAICGCILATTGLNFLIIQDRSLNIVLGFVIGFVLATSIFFFRLYACNTKANKKLLDISKLCG